MRLSETSRVVLGAFTLYWLNQIVEVLHFHPGTLGLPKELVPAIVLTTSVVLSLVAGAIWLLASYCLKALRHWRARRSCNVPGAPANNP
jgi:hypothetical protein